MTGVDAETAASSFPELLARVKRGEEVAIIERGKSVAKLVVHPADEALATTTCRSCASAAD